VVPHPCSSLYIRAVRDNGYADSEACVIILLVVLQGTSGKICLLYALLGVQGLRTEGLVARSVGSVTYQKAVINGCGGTLLEWLLAKEQQMPWLTLTNLNVLPWCLRR
jgi:hypothetical protein